MDRLVGEAAEQRYASAAALLEDLERLSTEVPANTEAWERLLRLVRDHEDEGRVLRRSA